METIKRFSKEFGKIFVPVMTEEEFTEFEEANEGFCIKCGEIADCVEPDAGKYCCEYCEENGVYGFPELAIMGIIVIEEGE